MATRCRIASATCVMFGAFHYACFSRGEFSFFFLFFFFASNPPLPHQNLTMTFAGAYLHLLQPPPLPLLAHFSWPFISFNTALVNFYLGERDGGCHAATPHPNGSYYVLLSPLLSHVT